MKISERINLYFSEDFLKSFDLLEKKIEEINIKNFEEDGYLYFNEIYSAYWNVYINSKKAELINNDGFMSVKINKGNSQVIFIFDNSFNFINIIFDSFFKNFSYMA